MLRCSHAVRRGYATAVTSNFLGSSQNGANRDSYSRGQPQRNDHSNSSSTLEGFNSRMSESLHGQRYHAVFAIATKMKEQGISPSIETYHNLLKATHPIRVLHQGKIAWSIFNDLLAANLRPSQETFELLLKAQGKNDMTYHLAVLQTMKQFGFVPSPAIYTHFVSTALEQDSNIFLALAYFFRSCTEHGPPELPVFEELATQLAQASFPQLAIDLVEWYHSASPRQVGPHVWLECLRSSADSLWLEGTEKCWKTVNASGVTPDEGLCILVLNTAARTGAPGLASSVVQLLNKKGIPFQEYHLAPLVEAFVNAGQYKEAFSSIAIMRSSGVAPSQSLARVFLAVTNKNPALLTKLWNTLDGMVSEEQKVDRLVLNILIAVAAQQQDLQKAMALFQAFPDHGHSPDRDSFHIIIQAAIETKQYQLAEAVLDEMKKAGIPPDNQTYEFLIILSLNTSATYERSFDFLRHLDENGVFVSDRVYFSLLSRLIVFGDPRWRVARDILQSRGTTFSAFLSTKIAQAERGEADDGRTEPPSPHLDRDEQNYIDAGGLV